jgi:hypothetical protein
MLFAIPAEAFEHRFDNFHYGEYNQALDSFVSKQWEGCMTQGDNGMFLNLESVFVEQARQAGVQQVRAEHSLAEYPRLAHTRDGGDISRRNLIVVKREP